MEAISLTLNISTNSWSNLASKDSFKFVLRIPKPTLALRFDKDLAKILEVEEKAFISKSPRFYDGTCVS